MPLNTVRLFFMLCFFVSTSSMAFADDCVILLHGMVPSKHVMASMATYLKQSHYRVVNLGYATTHKSINALAEDDLPPMIKQCQTYQAKRIHFVTFSLGGVVLRAYLQHHSVPGLGRVVMLSPPNHGSPLVDILQHNRLYVAAVGPAGQELATKKSSTPNQLKQHADYPLGIIAGNFNFNPFMKALFHGEHDGKVAVSSARLDGMQDFIVLPVSHLFMTHNRLVMQEVLCFLQSGQFNRQILKQYMGVFYAAHEHSGRTNFVS